jgi:hypothetical protein
MNGGKFGGGGASYLSYRQPGRGGGGIFKVG